MVLVSSLSSHESGNFLRDPDPGTMCHLSEFAMLTLLNFIWRLLTLQACKAVKVTAVRLSTSTVLFVY